MKPENEPMLFKVNQLTDTGASVSIALSEDIELEPVSQQQMMIEAIESSVTDNEVKEQIKPLLEAIMKSQPQTFIRTYPQTIIQVTMPKTNYERIGSPRVGDRVRVELSRVT